MCEISALWSDLIKVFPVLCGDIICPPQGIQDKILESIQQKVLDLGNIQTITSILELEIESAMRSIIIPKFWKYFVCRNDLEKFNLCSSIGKENLADSNTLVLNFINAIDYLYNSYQCLCQMRNTLVYLKFRNFSNVNSIREKLHNIMISQLPPAFNSMVSEFYCVHFRCFTKNTILPMIDSEPFTELPCVGCNSERYQCYCKNLAELVNATNLKLLKMDLVDRLAGSALTTFIKQKVKEYISDSCVGIFDRSHLKQLEMWINDVAMAWLTNIFTESKSVDDNSEAAIHISIQTFKVKLTYFMYETFAQNVIDQFFSVIIDYPDSSYAIDDLKICLEKIDMRINLTESLRKALEARILHPGVNTMDILTGYIAAIKAIRQLDSTGLILEIVTAPIKDYLRKRNDTVRRVVTGLTEDGPSDLSEELAKGEHIKNDIDRIDDARNWESWEPDPFGINPNVVELNNSKKIRSADIISMVVDIYGSKELFMVEYRNLMGDRLLSQLDFNSEKEIRNLELLKIRFGESLLHSCEVMLKDVTDSKRINSHIHGNSNCDDSPLFDISALIISAQFWPSFNKENLCLPEELENEFKKFTRSYESYKGNRTLNWRTVTGRVNITIEIGNRILEMVVPPTQAVIIYHFQHQSEWNLEELSGVIKIPLTVLRRRITFWQHHGLIIERNPGVFSLVENESEKSQTDEINIADGDEEDLESAMASASDQREEELQVFWSYIVGMLTNLDCMPIDRIHQMLKLFASHGGGFEFTQDELKHFLQRKVREHKLIYSGGVYQLAK